MTGLFLASKNLEIGSPVDEAIGGVRCGPPTPSEEFDLPVGGDIDSIRELPRAIGLVLKDFGEGDWATLVICLSSVALLFVEPLFPGTTVIRELAEEGIADPGSAEF